MSGPAVIPPPVDGRGRFTWERVTGFRHTYRIRRGHQPAVRITVELDELDDDRVMNDLCQVLHNQTEGDHQ